MTGIQWTDETLNPTTGCDRVSDGCDNCYALSMAKRLKAMGQAKYQRDGDPRTSGPGFGFAMHPDTLRIPLTWKKPRRVFVNSMSELFHKDATVDFIAQMWAVMAATPQHTYQILTKRHARMRSVLRDECRCGAGHAPGVHFWSRMEWASTPHSPTYVPGLRSGIYHDLQWPLPNVHLGVSAENQANAGLRVPALRQTPAAVRFISAEPLIGPIENLDLSGISWLIAGGESGAGARPCDPGWIRSLVDQCAAAGVACFVKQMGSVWARENGGPSAGGDPSYWPEDLRIREFPRVVSR